MTWHADRVEGRVDGTARDKLLAQRAVLEEQVKALAAKPLSSKSAAAAQFRQEDLLAIAKKIKAIDKKLGREIT
jgi:hypothetical protein